MGKDTKESQEIEKVEVEIEVRSAVPEGGWGWLICLAGFIAQFVVLGIQNNTGILYKALLQEFKTGKGETGKWFRFFPSHPELSYLVEHDMKRVRFRSKCRARSNCQATGSRLFTQITNEKLFCGPGFDMK